MVPLRGGVALTWLALGACNEVFGLDPVELAVGGAGGEVAAGGGGQTGVGAGGAGGAEAPLLMCHNPEYDPGLVLDGDFELDTYTYSYNTGPLCQGSYFAWIGPQTATEPRLGETSYVHPAEPGALDETPCVFFSVAARDFSGVDPTLWLTFDVPGVAGWALNQLTPAGGLTIEASEWTFYSGSCRLRLPDTFDGFADLGLWVEGTVYLDALSVLPIACDASIPECIE